MALLAVAFVEREDGSVGGDHLDWAAQHLFEERTLARPAPAFESDAGRPFGFDDANAHRVGGPADFDPADRADVTAVESIGEA